MIRSPTCPICRRVVPPATAPGPHFSPFCSKRCQQIDFFRWTEGRYAIVEPLDPETLEELQLGEGLQTRPSDSGFDDDEDFVG